MAALEARQGARLASLEGAILKGLKAISDKVSAALAEKLDVTKFNEFKVQVGGGVQRPSVGSWQLARCLGRRAGRERGGVHCVLA